MRLGRLEIIWHAKVDPYCQRPGHKCATPGHGPCNGLPRLSEVYANPALVGTERKADVETDDCTCSSAGAAFKPQGHYADCPDAERCAYGRDCTMPWTPHVADACAPSSHDDCPPEGCPPVMPEALRAALDDDPRVAAAWEYPRCRARFRSNRGYLVACELRSGHYVDVSDLARYSPHVGQVGTVRYQWMESDALYPGEDHITPGEGRCDGCA